MSNLDTPNRDLNLLAPKFKAAVEAAIADCATKGLPVKVNEGLRSKERQAFLFAKGRTTPGPKVTNASTNLTSWHGYGLAVDVIHKTLAFAPFGKGPGSAAKNEKWFKDVATVFKAHGCDWGGDWKKPDTPHMQWGACPASPTAAIKALMTSKGMQAVWKSLGAE